MSKRHQIRAGDWESIIGRLEELVLANSGEDEFEEIFKLLVAKLFSEMRQQDDSFCVRDSPTETSEGINALLAQASDRWKGIFLGDPRSRLTDEHLSVCVYALQSFRILDSNLVVIDGLFEYLVNRAAKGAKGQYFTPRHVIDACVRIVNPSSMDIVLDPACGSAGFLVHTLNHVTAASPETVVSDYATERLWGFDFDQRAVRVAKALMLIAGDGHSNIMRVNSLLTPDANASLFQTSDKDDNQPRLTIEDVMRSRSRNFKGFDVIMTNPPFAGEVKEEHILKGYELFRQGRRIERDVLFLERCIQLLKPGGRIAIVLPHNKVGTAAWGYAREWLIRELRIVSVLGLGRATFLPHTHQKTSVVFGTKRERPNRQTSDERILFMVSERSGKDSKGQIIAREGTTPDDSMWLRADHDLGELVDTFHAFVRENNISWGAEQWHKVQS